MTIHQWSCEPVSGRAPGEIRLQVASKWRGTSRRGASQRLAGRYSIADLAFNGAAEKAHLDFGDFVTAVDVERPGQPPKELVYPAALLVLAGVIAMQWIRRRRQIGS